MTGPILMADDDRDDCMFTERALKKGRILNPFITVGDGEELLDYLFRRGKYSNPEDSPRPVLILLDLNMPRLKGLDALEEMKANPDIRKIPVVVLTTSKQERDIVQSYDRHVSGYIVKPVTLDGMVQAMTALDSYWFDLVKLPAS